MREFNFDVNFLDPGDIITKSGGGSYKVVSAETHVYFKDQLVIRKDVRLREITGINGAKIDVSIKS